MFFITLTDHITREILSNNGTNLITDDVVKNNRTVL